MRVITGAARGAKLAALPGDDVRPTAQRVKESVFSAIQFYVPGAKALDLFAGSGQMGIEALSRGAVSAVFVDGNDDCVKLIRKNVEKTGFLDRAKVIKNDSFRYLSRADGRFDIVFIDPPYGLGLAKKALRRLEDSLENGAFVICETEAKAGLPERAGDLSLVKKYGYGQTDVWLYRADTKNKETAAE